MPGLTGGKMSASEDNSKIDLLDTATDIKKKIKKVFCEPGNISNNPLLLLTKHILIPVLKPGEKFLVNRSENNGGRIEYSGYEDLEKDFAAEKLHPLDFKNAAEMHINRLLDPIRKKFMRPDLRYVMNYRLYFLIIANNLLLLFVGNCVQTHILS